MTEDITSLQIRIKYLEVKQADAELDKFDKTAKKSEKSLKLWAAAAVTATAATAAFVKIVQTTRQFQIMQAAVESSTGSIANMEKAWGALVKFASTTPYSLDQAVNGFVKLVNLGLTPSERALQSYGETASAMGKDLSQMIEAVADAATGEFERLKEFGIKANKQGDQVKLTFRGVSSTVKFTAAEIEKYLIELGENNFAGSMAKRMETLDGAISNMGDTWDQLLFAIGQEGIGDAAESGIRGVTEALDELLKMVKSGELGTLLDSQIDQFEGWSEDLKNVFEEASSLLNGFGEEGEITADEWSAYWNDVFTKFPSNVRYMVKRVGIELATMVNVVAELSAQAADALSANFEAAFRKVESASRKMRSYLPGGDDFDQGAFDAETDRIFNNKAGGNTEERLDAMFAERQAEIDQITEELDRAYSTVDEKIAAANERRTLWEFNQAADAAENATKDALEEFAVLPPKPEGGGPDPGNGSGTPQGGMKPRGGRKTGSTGGSSEWASLEDSLRNEETLIGESYERRLALIEANTRQGSEYQAELEISLTEKFEEEQQRRIDKMKEEPETMFQAFAAEEMLIEESYERRKEIILSATELTEEEKLNMLEEAELKYTASMRKHETERNKMTLGLAADFFGNLSTIAGAFGKKGAKIAKAAAIVQTTIKTYESATSAYASLAGIPYVGPALGAVAAAAAVAAGMANIQKIRAQDDSGGAGSYAMGGIVPGNSTTGDRLTANVNSKEMILNQGQQANLFALANGQNPGGGNGPTINIFNQAPGVEVERKESGDGMKIDFVIKKMASEIRRGGNPLAQTLEETFNLRRA